MKNVKLLFIIIPWLYWAILGFGILEWLAGNTRLAAMSANLFIFFAGINLGIIWHEIGHLLMASWTGGQPRRMVLGQGPEVTRWTVAGIKVILHSRFRGGVAFAAYDPGVQNIRGRYTLYTLGGVLFNALLAYVFYLAFGFELFFTGRNGLDIPSALIGANLLHACINLIPFHIDYQGLQLPSDGLNLAKIPFYTPDKLQSLLRANDLLDAFDYYEQKEYDRALELYDRCLENFTDQLGIQINRSAVLIKMRAYREALEILESLQSDFEEQTMPYYRALVYNNMAWIHLIQGNLEKAEEKSEKAFNLVKNNHIIAGTRGAVLIEKGDFDAGIKLIEKHNDFSHACNDTVTSAIFLAHAYHKLENPAENEKYISFVRTNQHLLDADDWDLLKRIDLTLD